METTNMEIQIARAGQVIGTFTPDEIEQNISQGLLNPDDQFWREGMAEWKPLEHMSFYIQRQNVPQPPPVPVQTIAHKKVRSTKAAGFWMVIIGVILFCVSGGMSAQGGGAPSFGGIMCGMIGFVSLLLGFVFFISARMKQ